MKPSNHTDAMHKPRWWPSNPYAQQPTHQKAAQVWELASQQIMAAYWGHIEELTAMMPEDIREGIREDAEWVA